MKLSRKVNFGLCKTIFKSNLPITTNHLIYMNMKMKQSYQIETGEWKIPAAMEKKNVK